MSDDTHDTMPPWAAAMEERLMERIEDVRAELKAALTTTVEGMFEAHHKIAQIESSRPTERPATTGAE